MSYEPKPVQVDDPELMTPDIHTMDCAMNYCEDQDNLAVMKRFAEAMQTVLKAARDFGTSCWPAVPSAPKPNMLQQVQELRLRLSMKSDGNRVADDLNAHPEIWESYIFTPAP